MFFPNLAAEGGRKICSVFNLISSGNRQKFEILTLLITQMRGFLSEIPVIHQLYNQLHVAKVKSVITHEKLRKTHHVFFFNFKNLTSGAKNLTSGNRNIFSRG